MAKAKVLIGTSGWMYKHWGEVFYPKDVKGTDQLLYFTKHFSTVEINSTFYRLPHKQAAAGWCEKTPDDFMFAVKMNNYLTHTKKFILDEKSQQRLQAYFDLLEPLRSKMAVVLVQIQPSFRANFERLDKFLRQLGRYRADLDICFEPRHQSWFSEELYEILRRHQVGFVIGTYPGKFDPPYPVTTDVVYIRYHATAEDPAYTDKELDQWADYIASLQKKAKRIYIYFNNDFEGYAITNAQHLKKRLHL